MHFPSLHTLLPTFLLFSAVALPMSGPPAYTGNSDQQIINQEVQDGTNKSALAISPAINENIIKPGEKKVMTLNVSNLTAFPLPISGTVKNFIPLEDIDDPNMRSVYDASKWITIAEPDFILQAKQTRQVSVTIQPPLGSEPGGHYATIYFQPLLPEGVLTPSTAYLSARVGSLTFIIVPGAIEQKIEATRFAAPTIKQSAPVDLSLRLANKGNVHISSDTVVTIKDWRGKEAAKLPVKLNVVMPGTHRDFTVTWKPSHAFGRYTASAEVTYGSEHKKVRTETVSFWIIPWVWILSIVVPASIIALLVIKTRGRWKRAWHILRGNE